MDGVITEKNYPIRAIWVVKSIILAVPSVVSLIIVLALSSSRDFVLSQNYLIIIFLIATSLQIAFVVLNRIMFHYSVESEVLNIRQGIVSRQQRDIPYGVIQHVLVKQDLLDRLLGLASLTIENASQGAGAFSVSNSQKYEQIGSRGNKVSIPGLSRTDAEELKAIVLEKMKDNPIEDSQSGL